MRTVVGWGGMMVVLLAGAALAEPEVSIVIPSGVTTLTQGGELKIEIFVNNVTPDRLRAYQAGVEIIPQSGATGTITLADTVTPAIDNTSIIVDETRPDWVFAGLSGFFTATNVERMQVAATLFDPADAPTVTTPKYLGEMILKASADAVGDFVVQIATSDPNNPAARPTQLVNENGLQLTFTTAPPGGHVLTVSSIAPNDACAAALPIGDGVTLLNTRNTTTDGPPHPGSACDVGGSNTIDNDVWFDYTATCSGVLAASTCGTADFDTRVAVYDGCACPVSDANLLTCSDDALGCGNTSEAVVNGVFQGACYKIRVGGTNGASGTGSLLVTCIGNDQCGNADPIAPGGSVQGSTRNTSVNDTAVPACGAPVDSPGVWYAVTGTGDLLTASVSSSSFDTRLTVFEGSCAALSCVADADNPGGSQETISWCSTPGVTYFILVHGSGGTSGTFALRLDGTSCDDGSVCTTDSCSVDHCVNTPTFDDTMFCCNPADGTLTPLDDGNPCTLDLCNAATGAVGHPPAPDGPEPACADASLCTLDQCLSGSCVNTDVSTIPCATTADCPQNSSCVNGFCFCEALPTLFLEADPGASLSIPGCYAVGETITVRVELGPRDIPQLTLQDIVGAQFFLEYDATTLDFLDIVPGFSVDPTSPFSMQLGAAVDEINGTIDYVVGTALGGGTRSPSLVAVVRFQALAECNAFVRFRPSSAAGVPNLLTLSGGTSVDPLLNDLGTISTSSNPPLIGACPANITVPPDPGQLTAVVTWTDPTATDACDGPGIPVTCSPPSGSTFSPGTTTVTCTATDSCGRTDSCSFSVTVVPPTLTFDMELSPTVSTGTLQRCVTFELWDCDAVGGPLSFTLDQDVTFTGGSASNVTIPIPGGGWDCLSARDPLHTLRATSADFGTLDGTSYTATFLGPWPTGGHWLLGGNLNGDDFIDIVDFAVFFPLYLTPASSDTPCGTASPHADINGDNVVDLLDLIFISTNSLMASQPPCCGGVPAAGGVAIGHGPRTSITFSELRRMGLGDLSYLDTDANGVFDFTDVEAILGGTAPLVDLPGNRLGPGKRVRRSPPRGR